VDERLAPVTLRFDLRKELRGTRLCLCEATSTRFGAPVGSDLLLRRLDHRAKLPEGRGEKGPGPLFVE
jgi:hypothetical protein